MQHRHTTKKKFHLSKRNFWILFVLFWLIAAAAGFGYQHRHRIRVAYNQLGVAKFTRADMTSVQSSMTKSNDQRSPQFTENQLLSDVPSSRYYDTKTGQWDKVAVWDSWPVTKPDGTVANFHGYRLVMGLTSKGQRVDVNGVKIGLYAQKISDNESDISSWQYLGDVFETSGEGHSGKKDEYLDMLKSEWSGSTTMMHENDTTLRVFYTNAIVNGNQAQALTTAKVQLDPADGSDWNSGLTINHEKASDHKTVFVGDGKIYETYDQAAKNKGKVEDSFAMRDPHFVVDGDKYYLTFEGNTARDSGEQGAANFKNYSYFGNYSFYKKDLNRIKSNVNSNEYDRAYQANAALGKLELNKDFTVKKVMKPMVTANATLDIMERPNLFEYKGKWYLFTCFTGKSLSTNDPYLINKNYMFGYVSDNGINGTYKPLNGNGLVLQGNLAESDPAYSYAYLVVRPEKVVNDQFVVTAFQQSHTFAPSYIMQIKGHKTKMITNKVLDQGALNLDGKTYKATAQDDTPTNK